MSYLSDAHARLLIALADAKPSEISLSPKAEQFEDRRAHIEYVAGAFDAYLHALAIDAADNLSTNRIILTPDFICPVSTAVSDLTSQFTDAAEYINEGSSERCADPKGWAKADALGVA